MIKDKLRGCGTALVTPFADGKVDYDAYRNLVRRQVGNGIDFLVPLGSTAETPCIEDDEKVKLLKITVEESEGRPVIAGCGTNSLVKTLKNISLLDPCGPDAYLAVVPYYNKPTQEGLFQYFKAVAESTDKGIVLYNVPGRTGTNMTAETTLRLAEIPNIIAVKEASGNLDQIVEICRHAPAGFSVLSGNDDQTLPVIATGGDGVISVASNIAPAQMVELVHSALASEVKAIRLNYKLLDLYRNCFVESNPIPAKAALSVMGLCRNELRLPLTPATEKTVQIMKRTVENLGLLSGN